MIVAPVTSECHSAGIASQHYGMSNIALLEDALSSRMYKDAHYATIREILANARDANREAGVPQIPVRIFFPGHAEASLRIQDNGIGINKTRMVKNFAMYCESTKSNSNKEHGGYGLGCKTPFSIGKSFTVTTVAVDEDGIRRRRVWSHFKDSAGRSSYAILDEYETNEDTGTEVSIPMSRNFTDKLIKHYNTITKWWDVIPDVPDDPSLKAHPASVNRYHPMFGVQTENDAKPMAIMDGIPYEVSYIGKTPVVLFFGIGELPITITRDDLDSTAEPVIRDRMIEVVRLINSGKLKINNVNEAITLSWALGSARNAEDIRFENTPHGFPIPEGVVVREITRNHIKKMGASYDGYDRIALDMSHVRRNHLLVTTRRKSFALPTREWIKHTDASHITVVKITKRSESTPFAAWLDKVKHGELESMVTFDTAAPTATVYGPAPMWVVRDGKRATYRDSNLSFPAAYVLMGRCKEEAICSITGQVLDMDDMTNLGCRVMILRRASDAAPHWLPLRTKMINDTLESQRSCSAKAECPPWLEDLDRLLGLQDKRALPFWDKIRTLLRSSSVAQQAMAMCYKSTRTCRSLWGVDSVPEFVPTTVESQVLDAIPKEVIRLVDIDATDYHRSKIVSLLTPEPEYHI